MAAAQTPPATEGTTRTAAAQTRTATEGAARTPAAETGTPTTGETRTPTTAEGRAATIGLMQKATAEAWAPVAEGRTAVAERRTAVAEGRAALAVRARPPTAPRLAASRDPAPATGSPRSATARPSRRPRRRRRTGPTLQAGAAHTTGTSEPRSLPNPPRSDGSPAVTGTEPLPASPATEVLLSSLRRWSLASRAGLACLARELNGLLDGQQRIRNRPRASPPRHHCPQQAAVSCLPGSGLPAAVPSAGGLRTLAAVAGARTLGPKRRTSRRIYGPAGCPDCILGTTWPAPKAAANPLSAQIQTESGQGSDVTEIICPVTVTCDGNGAAAAARPVRISHRRLRRQRRPRPPRAQAGTRR
jgi:hypothetical protein